MKDICPICKKEFELSNSQKQRKRKEPNAKLYCSPACRNKGISLSKTQERPILKCKYCGKEFEASRDQLTKYNKNPNINFFCCKGHAISYGSTVVNYEERAKKVSELAKDKDYIAARTAKAKQTNLERYGVENPFQAEVFKQKSRETKLEKYGDENYNNSEQIKQTYHNKSLEEKINISSKRSKTMKKVISSRTPEEWKKIKLKLSLAQKAIWENFSEEERAELINKFSIGQKNRWENMTEEEKSNIINKSLNNRDMLPRIISKINRKWATILNTDIFEKNIGKYSYDLQKDNTLIEIDPTYTHNNLLTTYYGSMPRNKLYHYNKSMIAKEAGYECIHIFDWDDENKIKYMFQDKKILYARNLKIKNVLIEDCDIFLDNYHLQNTCKNQEIRLGLYQDAILIEIMTFGTPRYNKNYEWELLRLCTHKDYKVVGGAEKLFKEFLNRYEPNSIISYCDFSKFTGSVYERLGFKQEGNAKPSKHWSKGTQHITDNLLRQRGYDQLFGTNYGKGTSNEELMLENGWLPIYDCGQLTFIWRKE